MCLCTRHHVSFSRCLLVRSLGRAAHGRPVHSEENAVARARKQRAPGFPQASPIRLRRSWDESSVAREGPSSRRARSLSSGTTSAPLAAYAPVEAYTPYSGPQSTGLTRTVDNLHLSELPQGFEPAPFSSSLSSYSSETSPVESHFPTITPISWSSIAPPQYMSSAYPSATIPTPQSGHSSRPSSSGMPIPLHISTEPYSYRSWDMPTPPSEAASPRTSEPETYSTYALPIPVRRPPPPPPAPAPQPSRPRLHHSLSLPVGSSDGHYSTLVSNEYAYHHPYKGDDRPPLPYTTHASSVTLERQYNMDTYFGHQDPQHMYRPRYEDHYEPQPSFHEQRRFSEHYSPDATFTPAHEVLAPPLLDRPLSPLDVGQEWEAPRMSVGLGVMAAEGNADEFGLSKYAPTW